MNKFLRSLFFAAAVLFSFAEADAQTSLTQTTLSAAISSTTTRQFAIASTTGVVAGTTILFVDSESMPVVQVLNATTVVVQRGGNGTRASGHVSGAGVLVGPAVAFVAKDPQGSCTIGSGVFQYTPVVNITNGLQWLCSIDGRVTPGWGNSSIPPNSTAVVASAAGLLTPTGPLFHVTGTAAVTGFAFPVGADPKAGMEFCIIPDGIFTDTTANNIALVSTVVVAKSLCFSYDPNSTKFYPSY